MRYFLLAFSLMFFASTTFAKKVKVRKVQELNFSEVDINGKARNPQGSYLVRQGSQSFESMIDIKNRFDHKVKKMPEYLQQ